MNLGKEINVSIDLVHPFQGLNSQTGPGVWWKWVITDGESFSMRGQPSQSTGNYGDLTLQWK